jgi:hypothetical protein
MEHRHIVPEGKTVNIISGQNVDLITPFPATEAARVYGWNHCYKTISDSDDIPKEKEQFTAHVEGLLLVCPSFGLIDKNRLTNQKHEAPLIGIGIFEPAGQYNGFLHFASGRKAFKMGLIDEGGQLMVNYLFENLPTILRIGAYTNDRNSPAKSICRRLGFKFEGLCEDMLPKDGKPQNVAYFGLTRRNWICQQEALTSASYNNNLPVPDSQPETQSLVESAQLEMDLQTQEQV